MNHLQKTMMASMAIMGAILISTDQTNAQSNWLYIGSSGDVSQRIDLSSYRLLPNGIVTYTERTTSTNPFTRQPMNIDSARGIYCRTGEIVRLQTGKRSPITDGDIDGALSRCPGPHCNRYVVAYRNFCPAR